MFLFSLYVRRLDLRLFLCWIPVDSADFRGVASSSLMSGAHLKVCSSFWSPGTRYFLQNQTVTLAPPQCHCAVLPSTSLSFSMYYTCTPVWVLSEAADVGCGVCTKYILLTVHSFTNKWSWIGNPNWFQSLFNSSNVLFSINAAPHWPQFVTGLWCELMSICSSSRVVQCLFEIVFISLATNQDSILLNNHWFIKFELSILQYCQCHPEST